MVWRVEDEFKVIIGGNTYINIPNIIVHKGSSLFTIKRSESDGLLGIDFDIYDKDHNRVATVRNGVIVQGNEDDYDITTGMDRYTVTEKSTDRMICDIRKRTEAQHAELEVSVELYTPDGFLFNATPDHTNIGGIVMKGNVFKNSGAGIVID